MPKILMLRGLPASGKSTIAERLVKESGNYVRVNRDSLRRMLHSGVWSGKNEGLTQSVEKALVRLALAEGKSVVVDDTNLTDRHREMWSSIASESGATFEVRNIDTPLDDCLFRDSRRPELERVGKSRIIEMARLGRHPEAFGESEVIVDVDGTLADIGHRLHHIKKEPKDWKSFFSLQHLDTLRTDVFDLVMGHHLQGDRILVVSARPDEYREPTEQWLRECDIPYFALFMRPRGDHRPDEEVKLGILEKFFIKEKIRLVIDDRPRVVRMWRENGLHVIDVGPGVEF